MDWWSGVAATNIRSGSQQRLIVPRTRLRTTFPHAPFLFPHRQPGTLYLNIFALGYRHTLNVQASTKVTLLPVCFYCLVTLRQRLWFVSTILALYKFVCMYVLYVCPALNSVWSSLPRTRLRTMGDRSFRVMAARAWNSLPTSVTTATSLASFKKQLQTFLFTKSFPCPILFLSFPFLS